MSKPVPALPVDEADRFLAEVRYPDDWDLSDAEEMRLTLERLADFERTGLGYTLEDYAAWIEARRTDPTAPWPEPRKLR